MAQLAAGLDARRDDEDVQASASVVPPNDDPPRKAKKSKRESAAEPAAASESAAALVPSDPGSPKKKKASVAEVSTIKASTTQESTTGYPTLSSFALARTHFPSAAHDMYDAITSAFSSPTPIQASVWSPLLARRDVIGIAATGSGKTLAFVLPVGFRADLLLF